MTESPSIDDLLDYQAKDPTQALDAAREAVRTYCRWHIAPSVSATSTVWSLAGAAVWLPTMDLTAVTSVTQDAVVVASSTYTFESYGVIRRSYGNIFNTLTPVTVVYTHGYATMPDDVAAVILGLAQRYISDNRGLVARPGTSSGATFVETYGPTLTDGDKDRLSPFVLTTPLGA